jgi:hypothetical protein
MPAPAKYRHQPFLAGALGRYNSVRAIPSSWTRDVPVSVMPSGFQPLPVSAKLSGEFFVPAALRVAGEPAISSWLEDSTRVSRRPRRRS